MERIHDHLVVVTSQCNGALQLTALSSGFDAVTLSADLTQSSNVELRIARTAASSNTTALDDDAHHHVGCSMYPFERKSLVEVHKVPGKRAFVRVDYVLKSVCALVADEILQAQRERKRAILDATRRAHDAYYANAVNTHMRMSTSSPQWVVQRYCDDLTRFFTANGDSEVHFVDTNFPPTLSTLVGDERDDTGDDEPVTATRDGDQHGQDSEVADAALYSLASWTHLHDIVADGSWRFAAVEKPRSIPSYHRRQHQRDDSLLARLSPLTHLRSVLPGQDSLLCALAFLALDKHTWLQQLVTTKQLLDPCSGDARAILLDLTAASVQLCERGVRWKQVVVDLFLPVFPVGVGLFAVCAPATGELYPAVLQKALAKYKGSYKAVGATPTIALLRELTGVPWVSIYRPSAKQSEQARDDTVIASQVALQRRISRHHRQDHHDSNKRERMSGQHVFVASFEAIGAHHCAFPVLAGGEREGIALQDVDCVVARALGRPAKAGLGSSNTGVCDDDEDLVVCCSWHEFFQLAPNVWMALTSHHEAVRKRVLFVPPPSSPGAQSPTRFQFAFGLVEMTRVVIITQLDASDQTQQYALALDAVANDFALTRIAWETTSASAPPVDTSTEIQLVLALGAGEYVLSVEVASHYKDELSASRASRLVTSSGDSEHNIQLLFDCLDQDMDGVLSLPELQAFLDTHESQVDAHHITAFIQRFGSCVDNPVESLTLDDLRDVYQSLETAERRFEELIWDDLNTLLLPQSQSYDGATATKSECLQELEVSELRCCVRADAPLVGFVQLHTPLFPP